MCACWLEWEENVSRKGSGMRHVRCPGSDQRGQKWFGHVQGSANEDVRGLILRMELPGEVALRPDGQSWRRQEVYCVRQEDWGRWKRMVCSSEF